MERERSASLVAENDGLSRHASYDHRGALGAFASGAAGVSSRRDQCGRSYICGIPCIAQLRARHYAPRGDEPVVGFSSTHARKPTTLDLNKSRVLAMRAGPIEANKTLAIRYTLWCNVFVDHLTDVLTAISHPTRRAIIAQLANGPARFLDVAKPFDTALNAVTKHLKLLERAGLIEREKRGREVLISFRGEPLREVAGWVHKYELFWNERLDTFQQYFMDKKNKEKK